MGQFCGKCYATREPDEADAGGRDESGSPDAPLLFAAVPVAAESPVAQYPEAEYPTAESHKSTIPEAEPPVLETPEAKSPVAESPVSKSPVVEFTESKSRVAESPESESAAAEFPVSESVVKPPVGESPVLVEFPAAESLVPQDAPAPRRQQQDDRGGSSTYFPAPGTPVGASIVTPPKGKYLSFPILQDVRTIEYVQKSKVMIILKGLPGAGKSYIASTVKQMYKDAVVCSADYYFMKDGKYQFKADELNLAHESCQESAKKAAVSGTSVIVIDNTNVRAWNYKYYLGLSREHHYTPLILESQTPWAKNTKQLARRNSHGVQKEILDQKLKSYEPALPLYYWWFLNEADSAQIISMAQDWLKKALQVQDFFQDFSKFSKLSSVEEMLSYYKKNEEHADYKVLHATACVARRGKAKNAKEYMARKVVKDCLGKCFTLQLIGFVITPRTFGVRLRLGEDALELWGIDDHETEAEDTAGRQPSKAGQHSAKESKRVSLANTSVRRDSCQTTLRKVTSQVHEDRFCPTAGRGSRAHLTLGCAPGIHAKTTGFDLIKVVCHEQEMMKTENLQQFNKKMKTFSVSEGELRTYGNSIWVIYPEKEIHVNSLFSAFY